MDAQISLLVFLHVLCLNLKVLEYVYESAGVNQVQIHVPHFIK